MIADEAGTTPGADVEPARGLAARLRDAAAAADRLSDFSFDGRSGEGAPTLAAGEEPATAEDFVVRAVHLATDPVAFRILRAAATETAIGELAAGLELPRLALLERVHEMIQLGLVARDLERDTVRASPAGEALARWLDELAAETAGWLTKRRRP